MMDLEQAALDSRPPDPDDGPWLDDLIKAAAPWIISGLAAFGWGMYAHARTQVYGAREEAAVYRHAYERCAITIGQSIDRVEASYIAWRAALAPLYDRVAPVEMVPAVAEVDGGS